MVERLLSRAVKWHIRFICSDKKEKYDQGLLQLGGVSFGIIASSMICFVRSSS